MSDRPARDPEIPIPAHYALKADAPLPAPADPAAAEEEPWEEPLFRQNAIWFCQLRWLVVGVLAAAALAGFFPGITELIRLDITPWFPGSLTILLAVLNVMFNRIARGGGVPDTHPVFRRLLWTQIVTDLLILTAVIHWMGTGLPAAPFMYLFHIVLACIFFMPRESLWVAGLAAGFYLLCVGMESLGILPPQSIISGWQGAGDGLLSTGPGILDIIIMLLIWAVIWYLVSRLAGRLRHHENELALTNRRLRASSEERANHMLQTTHQLKAPFAAIHAQTQLLLGNYCGDLPDKARSVVGKISARSMALSRQIQEMLQLANLRSQGQAPPRFRRIALDQVVEEALNRIEPAARHRGIVLEKEIEPAGVRAIEDHLTMLVDNLIVNAVNYSHDGGKVRITCKATARQVTLVVQDQGIGIPREKLPHIFQDYYRTEEAVKHNRMSTGLGLAIVRQVVQESDVEVRVESAPGWGTRFSVTIPTQTDNLKTTNRI